MKNVMATRGEWFVHAKDSDDDLSISVEHGGKVCTIASVYDGPEYNSRYANARLIAEAPTMLDLLKRAVDEMAERSLLFEQINAVIARIEGKS